MLPLNLRSHDMPQFHIYPRNPDLPSTSIATLDASMVLNIIERMNCSEADVECEGRYAFFRLPL
ncbi:hypothetical protein ACFSTD_18225 [Novosphingobium colocasiae]